MKAFHLGLPLVLVGLFVACGGSDDGDTDNTAGASSTAGKTSTAGTTGTGTSGSSTTGTAGTSTGTAGSNTGTGGTGSGTAGTASGGQTQGQGGNANNAACPAAEPMDDDPCTPPAAVRCRSLPSLSPMRSSICVC